MICAVVVKLDPVVFKKKFKIVKRLQTEEQTDRQTHDARLKVIRIANYVYIE